MNDSLGKPIVEEKEQAKPKVDRDQIPVVSESREADLDKLVENVDAEIEAKYAELLASTDKRIESAPASVGVSSEKAESIYVSGGFAERVKGIKKKIATLAESTREKNDLVRLKLQGIKNPERILAVAHYLEGVAIEVESHHLEIEKAKTDKIEKEAEKFKKQGYSVVVGENYSDKTKMDVFATKETPYSFNAGKSKCLAKDINKMVGLPNEPVAVLDALHNAGYKINIRKDSTFYDAHYLEKLLQNPNVMPLLSKLKTFGGQSVSRDFGKRGEDALRRLSELATKDAAENILTPEAEKGIEKISALLGKPIDFNMLESWTRLSKDPVLLEILTALTRTQVVTKDNYFEEDALHKLEVIKESGVENEVATLLKAGFSELSLGKLYGWGEPNTEQTAKNLQVATEAFKTNPELQKLVLGMKTVLVEDREEEEEILGQKNIQRFQQLAEKLPVAGTAFANLADMGLRSDRWSRSLDRLLDDGPENALAYKEVLEAVAEPDFKIFATTCEKAGYKFTLNDFFNGHPQYNRLLSSYRNESFRVAIESESGAELAKYLGFFGAPAEQWNFWALESIAQIPNAITTLKKLEENYGYKYEPNKDNNNSNELTVLTGILEKMELSNKLFEPQTIETVKHSNSEFGTTFDIHEAEEMVGVVEDPNFLNALQDPERTAFVKICLGEENRNFRTILTLSKCDPTLRPVIGKMARDFGYKPRTDHHYIYDDDGNATKSEWTLADSEKYEELRDNPKIFEIQERLAAVGMSLDPFSMGNMDILRTVSEKDLFSIFERYKNSPKAQRFLLSNLDMVVSLASTSPEKIDVYIEIFYKIYDSPSQEIQRLKSQLLSQLLQSENPVEDYQKIENIFIKNNIPTVGKVFNVFEVLYDRERLSGVIKAGANRMSPVLAHASSRRRYYTIYQDLLSVHIESGNRSLKEYVEVLQSGSDVLDRYEHSGLKSLSSREQEQLRYFAGKLETLLVKSALDTAEGAFQMANVTDLGERIRHIREGLKVAEGQTVLERVGDMYLRPAGIKNLGEILEKMREAKKGADERGRAMVAEALRKSGGEKALLEIKEGDLLKGVEARYISNILQNGSVAKEFLGADSGSDSTPLDTDLSLVIANDIEKGNASAIGNSIANGYGSLLFVLKDHGRFQRTEPGSDAKPEEGKRELFKTGVVGERHYGIRTGFATTEIDFIIAKDHITGDSRAKEKMFFEIAQNGFYMPVTDVSGKVIFTPEMYDGYRKSFAGLEKFDAPALDYHSTTSSERSYGVVTEIAAALPKDIEQVKGITKMIRGEIEQTLGGLGVSLRPEFDTSILGAELLDTGSTGRHTNTPGDFDFDFSLKLDAKDFPRAAELAQAIKGVMTFAKDDSHQENGGYYQLRVKGVTSIGGQQLEKPLDIDIGFASKSDLSVYGSHDAIRDKLNYIKSHGGQEAYEQTIANVVLTKQILKQGHAYKKLEDGGFGGVGVENWILANGGNMEEAFKSFRNAAYENGQRLPYEKFKEKYRILDPGVNIKFSSHDNFIDVLKPNGYEAILNAIENYLNQNVS